MTSINGLKRTAVRRKIKLFSKSDAPAKAQIEFENSPFLFFKDYQRFQKILKAHGAYGAPTIAKLFPLKSASSEAVFNGAWDCAQEKLYFQKLEAASNAEAFRFADRPLAQDENNYNPDQPRAPAGTSEGGEWEKRSATAQQSVSNEAPAPKNGHSSEKIEKERQKNWQANPAPDAITSWDLPFDIATSLTGSGASELLFKNSGKIYTLTKEALSDLSRFLEKNAPHEAFAGAEHLSFKSLSKAHSSQNLLKKQIGKTGERKAAAKTAQKSSKAEKAPAQKTSAIGEIRLKSPLEEHEAAGGHMLQHHSPRTPEKLRERFYGSKPPSASSCFSSNKLMKETINKALKDNEKTIRQWLLNPKGEKKLQIDVKMHKKIGISVKPNVKGVEGKSNAIFILIRNPKMPEKFHILTGYPK